jgi:membrane protein YdbS with pleckstrin-like domain
MDPGKKGRPLTSDQRRARSIILLTIAVIVIVALGVGWLVASIGAPWWIAVGIVVVVLAVVGLFMVLQLS